MMAKSDSDRQAAAQDMFDNLTGLGWPSRLRFCPRSFVSRVIAASVLASFVTPTGWLPTRTCFRMPI